MTKRWFFRYAKTLELIQGLGTLVQFKPNDNTLESIVFILRIMCNNLVVKKQKKENDY